MSNPRTTNMIEEKRTVMFDYSYQFESSLAKDTPS